MKLEEKQEIAAIARQLIKLLDNCDDKDYVEEVMGCIEDLKVYPAIDIKYMW